MTIRLGPPLEINGSFADGADGWTVPEGWSVSGDTATSDGAEEHMSRDIGAIEGHTYRVDFDVCDYGAMFGRVAVGGTGCAGVQHNGAASADIVAGSSGLLELLGMSYSGGLRNITVREIL